MRIAMLAPIAWRTPPRQYGPWELVTSLLTEGLIEAGIDVTLFATGDSQTNGRLDSVCAHGYEEDRTVNAKVWESLHIANCFEKSDQFDIIHNHFDFLPLTYCGFVSTPLLTTIHGFSSPSILPAYRKYNGVSSYVSISDSDRDPELNYIRTIHHGIDCSQFTFEKAPEDYLLFFGRIHPDKGAREAIDIAEQAGRPLIMAGIIQDEIYFRQHIEPHLDGRTVTYIGSIGPSQKNELLGHALALLHPIHFNEPFGLSIVEAMACGTPTIAFNRGSMAEIITDGVDGFLVNDVPEAISAVDNIWKIDRTKCRKTVEERFCTQRMIREYIEVYHSILDNNRNNHLNGAW